MEKEYTIFICCNGGKIYNIHNYSDLRQAKSDLYNMVELERVRNRPYYVDNDFFDNEYPASLNCKIFCLKSRNVSKWEKHYEINRFSNNIINFPNLY